MKIFAVTIIKRLMLATVSLIPLSASTTAKCVEEVPTGRTLKTVIVNQQFRSEVALTVKASAPQSSWGLSGSEAAVLTVLVDGKYSQNIILFAGAKAFSYTALLGRLDAGRHKVDIVFDRLRSARGVENVTIHSTEVRAIDTTDSVERLALTNSPILYVRPDAVDKFSDIPLLTYYEIFPEGFRAGKIKYTTVYSNEDGGTQTAALMARWGRATDIEWTYEIGYRDGKRISETYQAANHETRIFSGQRSSGEHPQLLTATVNNNFSDRGCSAVKIANLPFRADLSKRSRESVMDEHPWTYLVMSQEAVREGRVDPARLGPNVIDDPRNYLYIDIYSELLNAAVSVKLTAEDGRTSSSDGGNERLRIGRGGFQRTAVRLPSSVSELSAITIACHREANAADAGCKNQKIVAVTGLDGNYVPRLLRPGLGLSKSVLIGL